MLFSGLSTRNVRMILMLGMLGNKATILSTNDVIIRKEVSS